MCPEYQELVELLVAARTLLEKPENSFAWSSWPDAHRGVKELNGLIRRIEGGLLPSKPNVTILFAPTGPIQEVSISSGWGQEFIDLATKVDAAVERAYSKSIFEQVSEVITAFKKRQRKGEKEE